MMSAISDDLVGKLDLTKMTLPKTKGHEGLIVVVLDPDNKIPDDNKTDNVFIQFVNMNYTSTEMEPKAECSVSGVGLGNLLYVTFRSGSPL